MATYFERLRAGMQITQRILEELLPGAQYDWAPMDNNANYPFYLKENGRKVLLYRFSKDSLVSMCDESHQAKTRELLRQILRANTLVP